MRRAQITGSAKEGKRRFHDAEQSPHPPPPLGEWRAIALPRINFEFCPLNHQFPEVF